MAMAPHWLDGIFEDGEGKVEGTAKAFAGNGKVKDAIDAGALAFREATREAQERGDQPWRGPSPAQSGRTAFLEHMNLEIRSPE
jgi:hypothetical protein